MVEAIGPDAWCQCRRLGVDGERAVEAGGCDVIVGPRCPVTVPAAGALAASGGEKKSRELKQRKNNQLLPQQTIDGCETERLPLTGEKAGESKRMKMRWDQDRNRVGE